VHLFFSRIDAIARNQNERNEGVRQAVGERVLDPSFFALDFCLFLRTPVDLVAHHPETDLLSPLSAQLSLRRHTQNFQTTHQQH
jgi:hypothetical protein